MAAMSTVATILVISGLVVTGIGVVFIVLARFERVEPGPEESVDVGKILEELNKLLGLLEARYRIGVVLMAVGLALVGVGAWLEARDANSAEGAPMLVARVWTTPA